MEQKVKAQTVWDIGILKLFCVIVGMIIGATFSAWVIQNVCWLVGIGVVLLVWLMIRIFRA
jgi:hypothetical protein